MENLERWQAGEPPRLLKVEIWPTVRCNLACQFCGSKTHDYVPPAERDLDDDALTRIVDECLGMEAQQFIFSGGGEPWLKKDVLLKLMRRIADAGRDGHLLTNGTLFSQEEIRDIVRTGWRSVIMSMDSPTGDVHDFLRGRRGSFQKTKEAMLTFRKVRDESGSDGLSLGLNCVITNMLIPHVSEMVRFASGIGCNEILFQVLMPLIPESKMFELTDEQQQAFLEHAVEASKLARNLGLATNLDDFTSKTILSESTQTHRILAEQTGHHAKGKFASIPCYEPWRGLFVTPSGRVSLCPRLARQSSRLSESYLCRDAWLGEDAEKLRHHIASGKVSGICKECCTNRLFENNKIRESCKGIG